jgi:3-hydroxyacyl-[acyl-carrier-protein] dehydratase
MLMYCDHQRIKQLLPHRFPIALVDLIVEVQPGKSLVARKAVTASEPCYELVDDCEPASALAYPPMLMVESFCQAAGLLWAVDTPVREDVVMLFGGMADIVFEGEVYPGEVMEHWVALDKIISDAAVFSGEIRVGSRRVATIGNVVVAVRSAESNSHGS